MASCRTLDQFLSSSAQRDPALEPLVPIVQAIASAGISLSNLISRHGLIDYVDNAGSKNADGDLQTPLDIVAHNIFETALSQLPVSFLASEEQTELLEIDSGAAYGVAIDPLDGSSNIETNMSIGTIFSVLSGSAENLLGQDLGDRQKAAGFLVYGPQTRLVLTCGAGTFIFLLEPDAQQFYQVGDAVTVPSKQREFAINTSNYRFWDDSVRQFIDDCIAGEDGPLGEDFNMRWNASLVAEAYRILMRGGVFLYPGDSRPGYQNGRLRLLYEALPLAFVIEQAGGMASDGNQRILESKLVSLHGRIPLIFGSNDRIHDVIDYITGEAVENTRFPLFGNRGLLRN
jgi:fructose-1,6-bisphosphatase I